MEEAKNKHFLEKRKNNILFLASSVSHRKNQELLVEAFSKVSKRFPDWNVEIYKGIEDSNYVSL